MKFFQCAHCGNIIAYVEDKGVPVMCCGEKMQEIIPGSVDAATEKHVPLLEQTGVYVTVKVGSVDHPMLPEHHIGWVAWRPKQATSASCLPPARRLRCALPCAPAMNPSPPMPGATSTACGRPLHDGRRSLAWTSRNRNNTPGIPAGRAGKRIS